MTDHRDFTAFGYLRAAAANTAVTIGDPTANAQAIRAVLEDLTPLDPTVVVFPELALTGYTAEDLFFSATLHEAVRSSLVDLLSAAPERVVVVGTPWLTTDGRLLNCAAVLAAGTVVGMVPKVALPNHGEFYERRWFVSGAGVDAPVSDPRLGSFTITPRQLFRAGSVLFGVEICEDLWSPRPPGAEACLEGAELMLNLSASNELVAKADYRRDLVRMTSAQWLCGYLYAGAGPSESTKDVVFGGHLLAAEDGHLLAQSERFGFEGTTLCVDFDIERLRHERMRNTTFANSPRTGDYAVRDSNCSAQVPAPLRRNIERHPFVPNDEVTFDARAREILAIQTTGLARRMAAVGTGKLVIGLSGGLDSTLAFLVCLDTLSRTDGELLAVTLPGPGTSSHTLESVNLLGRAAGVPITEIAITSAVAQHLSDLDHSDETDVVFENAQARERTQVLFNLANKYGGLVVGTGDLSELALGWCTFNADHMASYNVNASVPKTMMAYLVRWYARHRAGAELASVLERVLDTPISPELIPVSGDGDDIGQRTEDIIGPYELHDFFLFHFVRNGHGARKIALLAEAAFASDYDLPTIKKWLKVFFTRFFTQQFKRTTLPPGPKVGSVSLSPRGDWRMPDEAAVQGIIAEIETL